VIDLVNGSKDYNELMKNLGTAWPEMTTEELEAKLAKAMFIAETWGRVNE